MKPVKFNDTSDYQYMEVLGVEGVFSNLWIDAASLPKGFHKYGLRGGEDALCCQVSKDVLVNHAGDFISKKPLDLGKQNVKDLGEDDWRFTDKPFAFEEFFGVKLSLNCQIENATAKKNEKNDVPKSKSQVKTNPLETKNL